MSEDEDAELVLELGDGIDRSVSLSYSAWLLGFVERLSDAKALLRHRFPSKVGGRPAWLDPVDLPTVTQLRCPTTQRLMRFLLQIYAPDFDEDRAFHRSVFLFISPAESEIYAERGCVAFRSQMRRENPFYSPMPPMNNDRIPPPLPEGSVVEDPWNVADYEASFEDSQKDVTLSEEIQLFPEFNLSIQEELMDLPASDERIPIQNAKVVLEIDGADLAAAEKLLTPEQKDFLEFEERISKAPSQCVRYCFEDGAEPLLPNRQHPLLTPEQIPNCEQCGAPRRFEFQVLPQLLHFLGSDGQSYDWGSIVVYSCSQSCDPQRHSYAQEFAVVYPM